MGGPPSRKERSKNPVPPGGGGGVGEEGKLKKNRVHHIFKGDRKWKNGEVRGGGTQTKNIENERPKAGTERAELGPRRGVAQKQPTRVGKKRRGMGVEKAGGQQVSKKKATSEPQLDDMSGKRKKGQKGKKKQTARGRCQKRKAGRKQEKHKTPNPKTRERGNHKKASVKSTTKKKKEKLEKF